MLETQLTAQLKNLTDLHATLEEEKRCLTEKDFTSLNDTLFNKQKLLQSVTTLDKTLTTEQNLTQLENSPELMKLKAELESQLKECQKINSVNGKLVERSMKSNKHLMQLMTQATGTNSVTYDQKGALNGGSLLGKNIEA